MNLHLKLMSGAELPIVQEAVVGTPAVYLGSPHAEWASKADLTSLAFDGFVVEAKRDRLILAGNVPDGTLNAVYWLLGMADRIAAEMSGAAIPFWAAGLVSSS